MTKSALAIDGGTPAVPEGPPSWPPPDPEVLAALERAYADGSWGKYLGAHCARLATEIAACHDVAHALLCCSGTFAVELALRAVGVKSGDEVILAAYDFPGNFRAIEAIGATPVLVDIDPRSWCLDVASVEPAITDQVRAILVSHLHGGLAEMPRLRSLADQLGLVIVEDACQAPWARVAGRLAGTWGDAGVLSFGGSKLLTAGRGGAIVTARDDVAQRAKIHCERGNHAFPMSELQAAVLGPQLARIEERNARRRASVARLIHALGNLSGLTPLGVDTWSDPEHAASFYKLAWRLEGETGRLSERRFRFVAAARSEGVALDEGFRGFVLRGTRRCRTAGSLQQSRAASERTVILHHPVLLEPDATIDRIAAAIRSVEHEA